jgi:uncharacterized membrane protein (DUF106 family)
MIPNQKLKSPLFPRMPIPELQGKLQKVLLPTICTTKFAICITVVAICITMLAICIPILQFVFKYAKRSK